MTVYFPEESQESLTFLLELRQVGRLHLKGHSVGGARPSLSHNIVLGIKA